MRDGLTLVPGICVVSICAFMGCSVHSVAGCDADEIGLAAGNRRGFASRDAQV
jgi:hypothetical protein